MSPPEGGRHKNSHADEISETKIRIGNMKGYIPPKNQMVLALTLISMSSEYMLINANHNIIKKL